MDIDDKESDDLVTKLKKKVEAWHEYFKDNNTRFWDSYKFICATSLSNDEASALQALDKPPLQFNIIEAMGSRLLGEFAKHSPSFEVRAADGVSTQTLTKEFLRTLDVVEGILRAIFSDATNDSLKYKFYRDCIYGGFSVGEVLTEYANSHSFEQTIRVQRVFDPTLTFFDPLARESHKGDGMYAGKLVPVSVEDFKVQFPNVDTDDIKFSENANFKDMSWAYKNQKQKVILVAHMFVKEVKRIEIVKLTNGHVVPLKHYEKLIEAWDEEKLLEVPPKVLAQRWTEIEEIVCYQFCDTKILKKIKTDFEMLPIVFIDGNSVLIRGLDLLSDGASNTNNGGDTTNTTTAQFTKSYLMHARDMQKLMNFSGQSMAAEMNNIVQHQYIAPVEGIPDDQKDAYINPQVAKTLLYKQFSDKDPSVQHNPPAILERRQIPPILESTFNGAVNHMQTILGSYEATLGISGKQLSGVAIQQGAMQSNAAALPYLVGFNNGQSRFAEIVLNLIPKYYKTPRTLPIIKSDGKHDYQVVNKEGAEGNVNLDFDSKSLQIKVEMGVSAAVQKQVSMEMINSSMASNPAFADFFGKKGLEVYLDNMDIRGIDHLKQLSVEYMQEQQQAAEAASQQPSEVEVLANAELEKTQMQVEQKREQSQMDNANKAAEIAIKQQESELKFVELMAKIEGEELKAAIEMEKLAGEQSRSAVDMAIGVMEANSKSRE